MKIRIKDTPQAYKDIVETAKKEYHSYEVDLIKVLNMIGNEFEAEEHEYSDGSNYLVDGYFVVPKSACEVIKEPNYKIGDYVEIVDPARTNYDVGDKCVITKIGYDSENKRYLYYLEGDTDSYFYKHDIKPYKPNYLERARENRKSLEGKVIMKDDYFDLLNSILKTQDLILKHLESKEVE